MEKYKGRSSMKQYVKNKPVKWGFNFWYRCASETGYIYQSDLYLGKKESPKENLESGVFLKTTESLQNKHCMAFFDNFFISPLLIVKLYQRGLYGIDTARIDRKGILEMPFDRNMKRSDFENLCSSKVACCTVLFSNVKGIATTYTGPRGALKKNQCQKSKYLVQTLSKYTTKEWVMLT